MMKISSIVLVFALLSGASGCIVVKPVVGAGAAVGGAAVKTTAKVTTKAAGAAVDAVVPDGKSEDESASQK